MTATADTMFDVGFHADIALDDLRAHPHNPRKNLGELADLAESIGAHGIIQALVALPDGTIVCGHRRHAAAVLAGTATVPVVVKELDEITVRAMMIEENVQRNALSPLEEADAFAELAELGQSQRTIADLVKVNQSHISKRLKLRALSPTARAALDAGGITIDAALMIAELPAERQERIWRRSELAPVADPAVPVNEWSITEQVARQVEFEKRSAALASLRAKGDKVRWVTLPEKAAKSVYASDRWDAKKGPLQLSRIYPKVVGHSKMACHAYVLLDQAEARFEVVCTAPKTHTAAQPRRNGSAESEPEQDSRAANFAELVARQHIRQAFVVDVGTPAWEVALPYIAAVVLDGMDTYDETTAVLGRDSFDVPDDESAVAAVHRLGMADPSTSLRWLHRLATDTAEQVLTVRSLYDLSNFDDAALALGRVHLSYLIALGYEASALERELVGLPQGEQLTMPVEDGAEAPSKVDLSNRAGCIDFLLGHPDHRGLVEQVAAAPDKAAAEAAVCEQMHKRNLVIGEYWLEGTADGVRLGHLNVKLSWAEIVARALKTQPAADDWETDPPPSRPHAVAVSGPKGRGARKWSAVCSECDFDHKFTTERFATEAAAAHERNPESLEVRTA